MSTRRKRVGVALTICFLAACLVQAQTGDRLDPRLAWEERDSHLIQWEPKARYASLRLVVVGREGLVYEQVFQAGEPVFFEYVDRWGEPLPDGRYTYELRATPIVDPEVRAELASAREEGHLTAAKARLRAAGKLLAGPLVQSASFHLKKGRLVIDALEPGTEPLTDGPPRPFADVTTDGTTNWELRSPSPPADLQFLDKTVTPNRVPVVIENGGDDNRFYVAQSGNVGLGTSVPIEELHIVADDTPALRLHQTAGAFPLQEWDLGCGIAGNETGFFIRDATADPDTFPFQIEPGAPDGSLFVDDMGEIGIGTTSPNHGVELSDTVAAQVGLTRNDATIFDGNGLGQIWFNGTAGGQQTGARIRGDAAGTWSAGDSPGSIIFQTTPSGSSTLQNRMIIDSSGDVGIGTPAPEATIHVLRTAAGLLNTIRTVNNGNTTWLIESTSTAGAGANTFVINWSNTIPRMNFTTTANSNNFEFGFDDGDFTIDGDFFSNTCNGLPCAPDYVFEPGYELMPIEELAQFVVEKRHLPNVPSAQELAGPINISKMQMKLLEKVEELTLYTLQQEGKIDHLEQISTRAVTLTQELGAVRSENAQLKKVLGELSQRLALLEARMEGAKGGGR